MGKTAEKLIPIEAIEGELNLSVTGSEFEERKAKRRYKKMLILLEIINVEGGEEKRAAAARKEAVTELRDLCDRTGVKRLEMPGIGQCSILNGTSVTISGSRLRAALAGRMKVKEVEEVMKEVEKRTGYETMVWKGEK